MFLIDRHYYHHRQHHRHLRSALRWQGHEGRLLWWKQCSIKRRRSRRWRRRRTCIMYINVAHRKCLNNPLADWTQQVTVRLKARLDDTPPQFHPMPSIRHFSDHFDKLMLIVVLLSVWLFKKIQYMLSSRHSTISRYYEAT